MVNGDSHSTESPESIDPSEKHVQILFNYTLKLRHCENLKQVAISALLQLKHYRSWARMKVLNECRLTNSGDISL